MAQTFRKSRNQDEFNFEKNVVQRMKSQKNEPYDIDEQILVQNFNYLSSSQVNSKLRPVVAELTTLIYRQRENFITYDEFYVLLNKLKVCDDPETNLYWFRQLDIDNDNFISLTDIQYLLNQDLVVESLVEMIEPELILRVALEIFHHLSYQNSELDLKDVMNFIKFQLKEEIDFLETIEMFGFVQDLYYGQVKTKVSLQNYLQTVCPLLKKSLSKVVLRRCQKICQQSQGYQIVSSLQDQQQQKQKQIIDTFKSKRHGFHTRNTNSMEQIFSSRPQSRQSSPFQTLNNESIKSDVEKLIQKNFHLNLEVELQDRFVQQINEQEQIVNYLKENRPKIKGWLQRLSNNKINKWSLLFFQIDQQSKTLKAIRPQGVKKIIDTQNAEFQIIKFKQKTQHIKHVSHDTNKLIGAQQNKDNFHQASQLLKDDIEFLIIKENKQKSLILKSYDAMEINMTVHEIQIIQDKDKNKTNKLIYNEHLNYSGIIGLTEYNEKEQTKDFQKISKLQFKEFLLVIKDGKLIFYSCIIKFELPLEKITIGSDQSNLSFLPSHPFSFQLIQKHITDNKQSDYLQVNKKQIEQQQDQDVQDIQGSVIMWQIDEDDEESDNENKKIKHEIKKGLFSQLRDKFMQQKQQTIKETKIVLAAESELKRRQWIFSINYYKSSPSQEIQDFNAHKSNKSSYSQQVPSLSYNPTPIPSQQNYQQSPLKSSTFKSLYSQTNQLFIGGNHTHINMNVLNIGLDDDYYDIYRDDNSQNKQIQQKYNLSNQNEQYCYTDPNEQSQVKLEAERLITLPSKHGVKQINSQTKQFNQVINGTSNLELWQKFILSFFRFLGTHRKPLENKFLAENLDEELQEPQTQKIKNRRLYVQKQK